MTKKKFTKTRNVFSGSTLDLFAEIDTLRVGNHGKGKACENCKRRKNTKKCSDNKFRCAECQKEWLQNHDQ